MLEGVFLEGLLLKGVVLEGEVLEGVVLKVPCYHISLDVNQGLILACTNGYFERTVAIIC